MGTLIFFLMVFRGFLGAGHLALMSQSLVSYDQPPSFSYMLLDPVFSTSQFYFVFNLRVAMKVNTKV